MRRHTTAAQSAPVVERVYALVPVKRFAAGKSRLGAVLDEEARERLAVALCEHALSVLARTRGIAAVYVVTDGPEVAALARSRGAQALEDGALGPLGSVIDAALPLLAEQGATAALVLMADLPLVEPSDLEALVEALPGQDLVVAPDERDEGTNALLVRLAGHSPTCFGHRDSFARHLARAAGAGARIAVRRSEGLGFDVDEPSALPRLPERFLSRGPRAGEAPRGA